MKYWILNLADREPRFRVPCSALAPPYTGLHDSKIRGKELATQNVGMNSNELGTKHAR